MLSTIILHGQEIQYTVRRTTRTRRVKVLVRGTGAVEIVVPMRAPAHAPERFLQSQAEWILKTLEKVRRRGPVKTIEGEYRVFKEQARVLVHARLAQFNEYYKCSIGRVSIRDQVSRWGSCARGGNLNFNFRLVLIAPELADYVIVHELCHIKQLNHSPQFWALVAQTIPDYKARQKQLRQYSLRET